MVFHSDLDFPNAWSSTQTRIFLSRDVKWASPIGFRLALAGREPNGSGQKNPNFFRVENIATLILSDFRLKRATSQINQITNLRLKV